MYSFSTCTCDKTHLNNRVGRTSDRTLNDLGPLTLVRGRLEECAGASQGP